MRRFIFCIFVSSSLSFLQTLNLFGQHLTLPDSLAIIFHNQLTLFPQEKIYLHTDKPYYISGEKIWFRAYLADAITHSPAPFSRYVYVELINPKDSIVTRIKIRQDEDAYYGFLLIPDDAPQGNYTLRAYTAFMLNQEEHFFCTKSIYISAPAEPEIVLKQSNLILAQEEDFDVTFYPEGGYMMTGTMGKIAFKAMNPNGQSTNITGTVYNRSGAEVGTFRTSHSGMGLFSLLPQKGERYYAICENEKGLSRYFDLPNALDQGYALSVAQVRDQIAVSVQKPAEVKQNSELYLLAHTRGMIHLIDLWDWEKNLEMIHKEFFSSGVLHFILFDSNLHPVSERLVFIHNQDQAKVMYQPDKSQYTPRSLVKSRVTITDYKSALLSGSFSVSVTSDKEVTPDSTSSILTQLLLTSDLRGQVENPAFYFRGTPESTRALDLLMLTHGWRRYNIAEMAQGLFLQPALPLELGSEVSGTVKSIVLNRPIEGAEVNVISLTGSYFNSTKTDSNGRFHLSLGDFPDSTRFMVSVEPARGMTRIDLNLDRESFPHRTVSTVPPPISDPILLAHYAQKAEQQFIYEGGIRVTTLPAAVAFAERKTPRTSVYNITPDNSVTEEELEITHAVNIADLLVGRFPGIQIQRDEDGGVYSITIRGGHQRISGGSTQPPPVPPLILIDDIPTDIEFLNMLNLRDVAQIDVLSSAGNTAKFGIRGAAGVIIIYTKTNSGMSTAAYQPFHIKNLFPLGYQQPAAFYAPKYETDFQRNTTRPDLRTTIHWQPVVQLDSRGEARFDFYTADDATSYTVIIEGLAADGTIIRYEGKLLVTK